MTYTLIKDLEILAKDLLIQAENLFGKQIADWRFGGIEIQDKRPLDYASLKKYHDKLTYNK